MVVAALVCLALGAGPASAGQPGYSVGIAARDIDPDPSGTFDGKPVYLGGYGLGGGATALRGTPLAPFEPAGRAADGILADGIHVRAFVVSRGKHPFAIADIETQGWFVATKFGAFGLVDMRRAVARRTHGALPAEDVLIQSDHTHGGPDTIGAWGGVPSSYLRFIAKRTVDAIVDAYESRRPADLYYGQADGRDLLSNQMDGDPSGQNLSMDSEVRVLQARDPTSGAPFATLLNFSAHPTVLGSSNRKVTGDWPQVANTLIEQRFGGGAITMVGTLGRSQPNRGSCPDPTLASQPDSNPDEALCKLRAYAGQVVDRAARALASAQPLAGRPAVAARTYLIQDPATNVGLLALNTAGEPVGVPLNRSTSPPWLTANVIGTVTGSARIGHVLISAMPGEGYPQIPLKVREILTQGGAGVQGFMTAGLAYDQLGYIIAPTPEAYPYVILRGLQGNDNILFNISQTLGERVTCSLLRGAGEILGKGLAYWNAYPKCLLFTNDLAYEDGADTARRSRLGRPPDEGRDGEWLAGDLHVHTTYSHDSWGGPTDDNTGPDQFYTLGHSVRNQFAVAASRGLDFLAITDHNDIRSQSDAGWDTSGVLGIPAYENSLHGHAQMLGARKLYDNGDQSSAAVRQLADALRADGGVFQANHPYDPRWQYGYDVQPDTVEVWNLPWYYQPPFPSASDNDWALRYWEGWLDRGAHVGATGGSDNHWVSTTALQGAGQPTTWVFADDHSVEGILDGIRRERTFVSYQPPAYGGPLLLLEGDTQDGGGYEAMMGDTVPAGTRLRARVIGAPGAHLRVLTNGGKRAFDPVPVTGSDFEYRFKLPASSTWAFAELYGRDQSNERQAACDGAVGSQTSYCRNTLMMLALTSPIYLSG